MAVKFLDGVTIDGDVGIGTTNPSHPLSVISSYPQIKIQQNGASPYFTFGSGTGFAVFDGVGTSNALLDIRDDGTSRMRIDTAGNVGIGTTAPIAYTNYKTLTIDGSGGAVLRLDRAANDNQFEIAVSSSFTYLKNINSKDLWFGTNNTERMRITSGGNVGIGTTGPGAKLQVNGTNGTTQSIIGYGTQNLYIGVTGTNVDLKSSGNSAGSFTFSTGNTERLRITSGGNVGIGTNNPTKNLEVNGQSLFKNDLVCEKKITSDDYYSSPNGPGGSQQGIHASVIIDTKLNQQILTFRSGLLVGYSCDGDECPPQP